MKRDVSAILLFDDSGKVLLQHRDAGAPVLANQWAFFGGGIENGENPLYGVIRETMEELEYKLSKPLLLGEFKFEMPTIHGTMYVFAEKCDPRKKLVQHEGDKYGWFSISEALELGMANVNNEVLATVGYNNKLFS